MTHTIEATAWTLIHFCWQAALIAGVYRMASIAFTRRASETRYVLALAALLAMPVAAVFTFAWEMRSPASLVYSTVTNALASGDFPRMVAPGITSPSEPSASSQMANSLPNLMGWIDAFWVIGVLALSVRGLGGWWLIHRLRASAMQQAPEAVRAAFQRISHTLGLRKTVLLRISSAIASPITVGTVRAIVLLPVSAVTLLGPDELEVVLAHELAHVRRADFLWNLVQTLVETLFFFHPAVWWISGRIRHERELCCDDLALKVCPNPIVYASALFHLEEHRSRQMRLAMALDGHQSPQTLRMRIARILGESMPMNGSRSLRPFSAAAVFAAVVVLLLPAPQVIAGLRPSPSPSASVTIAQASNPSAIPTVSSRVAVSKPHPGTAPAAPRIPPEPQQIALAQNQNDSPAPPPAESTGTKSTYIDRMKAAGYDVDLDKMIAMKIQGVTPEYAQSIAQQYPGATVDDVIKTKIFNINADFIASAKKHGFTNLSLERLVQLRISGVLDDESVKE